MGTIAVAVDGVVCVDKPAGRTSHDVVSAVRRLAGTRRVGHAGTLDPAATGVLVLGIGRATRLLGHLSLAEKAYDGTIRLGVTTVTDDAEGEVVARTPAAHLGEDRIDAGLLALTGELDQVPSAVSAVKVGGERAYRRVRRGEDVRLAPRRVVVTTLRRRALRRGDETVDVDVEVVCSSGTYVRALARDLGAALGVGGHLVRLRRTRVGPFDEARARTLAELEQELAVIPMAAAAAETYPTVRVDADTAARVGHGQPIPAPAAGPAGGTVAVLGPGGDLLALYELAPHEDGPDAVARAVAVFTG